VIQGNAHKYPISAQCSILGIARSSYYHLIEHPETIKAIDKDLEDMVITTYKENRSVYGARKIKLVLSKKGFCVSRRKIGVIMAKHGLISAYTKKKYRLHKAKSADTNTPNLLDRNFTGRSLLEAVVSDVTYVRVGNRWAYTCLFLDLNNREMIGHAAGWHKDAELAKAAMASMEVNLYDIDLLHTDGGSEFNNMTIDEILTVFGIRRSVSGKSNPWDNAVAEAAFKLYKAEFVYRERFDTLAELQLKLSDYVHWYNHCRIHSTLGYMTPVEFRENGLLILSN
jgi:transposase InsO family protein